MADSEQLDAVVVGAGPAGTAAALTMAKGGLQVALVERGTKPGAKNVMGGILYPHALESLVGDCWATQAPLERPIIEEQRWLLTPDAAIRVLGHKNFRNRQNPHSFSVLRARFDPWLASMAEEAGAFLLPETVVEELLLEEGKVVGVKTGREGDLRAKVVVVAEGVGLGCQLLEKAGLKAPLKANQVAVAFKEVIALSAGVIEDRFNCEAGEGATIECYGESTRGLSGFMFIYTNRETVSVGGGVLLSELADTHLTRSELSQRSPNALLNHFKSHPAIRPLLAGGETVEYSAKMIPEGGVRAIPRLYGEGLLVCGDAAMLSNPVHREGSNLAMESGRLAGETALEAQVTGRFDAPSLKEYERRLKQSWVIRDMRKYDRAVELLEHNPCLLGRYPQLLDRALDEFFRVDGVALREKQKRVGKLLRKEGGWRMLWDLLKAAWTLK